MLPFCGYNMGDYFAHWLEVGKRLEKAPQLFRVNWFRTGENGKFVWPGFGDNLRVLKWVIERCDGRGKAHDTPIGLLPTVDAIDRSGTDLSDEAMAQLLKVDSAEWLEAVAGQEDFLNSFGERMPKGLRDEHTELTKRVSAAVAHPDLHGRDSGH
jgi:phosphoenolpyruvate carboxykinase (GTP)